MPTNPTGNALYLASLAAIRTATSTDELERIVAAVEADRACVANRHPVEVIRRRAAEQRERLSWPVVIETRRVFEADPYRETTHPESHGDGSFREIRVAIRRNPNA
jgi:hypothetical protein